MFKALPKTWTIFVRHNNSVAIKKGSKEGTTEFAQSERPVLAADRLLLENNTRHTVNVKKIIGNIQFFILII